MIEHNPGGTLARCFPDPHRLCHIVKTRQL
jgi:hypothetical protein